MNKTEQKQVMRRVKRMGKSTDSIMRFIQSCESGQRVKFVGKDFICMDNVSFKSHEAQIKQDIFKKVERMIEKAKPKDFEVTNVSERAWVELANGRIVEYEDNFRSSLKALEEKEIGNE